MSQDTEQAYIRGSRAAWSRMLRECCRNLGYDDAEAAKVAWIGERTEAIAALRDVCESHGDNDWPDTLVLADIIERHLARHLEP